MKGRQWVIVGEGVRGQGRRRGGAARSSEDQSGNDEMELGLTIHNSPGFPRDRDLIGRIFRELKVSIKICSACYPLNGVDHAVMILIEFLEMVVQNITYLRVLTFPLAMASTRVIPLGTFQ